MIKINEEKLWEELKAAGEYAYATGYAWGLLKPRQKQELLRAVQTYQRTQKTP